jgi:hypothetical protein
MIPLTYYTNFGCLNCTGMVMYWEDIRKRKQGLLDINQLVTAYFTEVTINNMKQQSTNLPDTSVFCVTSL